MSMHQFSEAKVEHFHPPNLARLAASSQSNNGILLIMDVAGEDRNIT